MMMRNKCMQNEEERYSYLNEYLYLLRNIYIKYTIRKGLVLRIRYYYGSCVYSLILHMSHHFSK